MFCMPISVYMLRNVDYRLRCFTSTWMPFILQHRRSRAFVVLSPLSMRRAIIFVAECAIASGQTFLKSSISTVACHYQLWINQIINTIIKIETVKCVVSMKSSIISISHWILICIMKLYLHEPIYYSCIDKTRSSNILLISPCPLIYDGNCKITMWRNLFKGNNKLVTWCPCEETSFILTISSL